MLVGIQALVSSAVYGTPQRSTTGYDTKRMNMLLAVLEKRCGFKLAAKDVFLNITGGIKINDTAIDLAVICSILSSDKETKREVRDCEKAIKEEYIINQFKASGSTNQVGPITYYYVANWQEESRNTVKQFNNVAYTATGQALVNIKVLAENTG